jgi:hypothetical protein
MFVTGRTVLPLFRPTARAMRWGPFLAAAGLGLAVVAVPTVLSVRVTIGPLITLLRIAAACGALGVAFLLDDPSTRTIPTVPTSRLVRHVVRAAVALPVAAIWWAATLVVSTIGVRAPVAHALPRAALTVEAAALVAVAFVLAASGLRINSGGTAGPLAAPALLVLLAGVWFLPYRVALILAPTDPHWSSAHRRWAVLLGVAVVGFVWAGRDPSPRGKAR